MFKTIIAGLAAVSLVRGAVIERRADPSACSIPGQQPVLLIGGGGGGAFCETRWPGDTIRGIHSWSNGKGYISSLEFVFSNGDAYTHGNGRSRGDRWSGALDLAPGEIITTAWLAGDGTGRALGKIHVDTFRTDGSRGGATLGTSNAPNVYPVQVGGGQIAGVSGHAGDWIDNFGFVFV